MPVSKNGETRHKVLDKLLSDRLHKYSMKDLNRICNEEVVDMGYSGVDVRTTQNDIKYLMRVHGAPIEYYNDADQNPSTGKTFVKKCLRYKDKNFSIYNEALSDDDKNTLREALTMFSQFSGLPNQSALNFLRIGFKAQSKDPIVGFSQSPMGDTSVFEELFKAISNKIVVELHYHVFSSMNVRRRCVFHPYYLREYNRRWYVFGCSENTGKLLMFGLERIDEVKYLDTIIYKRCVYDIEQILKKVVGVSNYDKEDKLLEIIFWVSDVSKEYVETKKIHWTQYAITGAEEQNLRSKYPLLKGGTFFNIECLENYELIRELCSFGPELFVLSPEELKAKIIERQEKILKGYSSLRK